MLSHLPTMPVAFDLQYSAQHLPAGDDGYDLRRAKTALLYRSAASMPDRVELQRHQHMRNGDDRLRTNRGSAMLCHGAQVPADGAHLLRHQPRRVREHEHERSLLWRL